MTEAISSISTNANTQTAAQTKQKSTLSNATKQKLEAMGINPSSVTSESEAQQKIKEAQAAQGAQIAQPAINNSMETVEKNARSLASEIEVNIGEDTKLDDIMNAISAKISEKRAEAGDDSAAARAPLCRGRRSRGRRWA